MTPVSNELLSKIFAMMTSQWTRDFLFNPTSAQNTPNFSTPGQCDPANPSNFSFNVLAPGACSQKDIDSSHNQWLLSPGFKMENEGARFLVGRSNATQSETMDTASADPKYGLIRDNTSGDELFIADNSQDNSVELTHIQHRSPNLVDKTYLNLRRDKLHELMLNSHTPAHDQLKSCVWKSAVASTEKECLVCRSDPRIACECKISSEKSTCFPIYYPRPDGPPLPSHASNYVDIQLQNHATVNQGDSFRGEAGRGKMSASTFGDSASQSSAGELFRRQTPPNMASRLSITPGSGCEIGINGMDTIEDIVDKMMDYDKSTSTSPTASYTDSPARRRRMNPDKQLAPMPNLLPRGGQAHRPNLEEAGLNRKIQKRLAAARSDQRRKERLIKLKEDVVQIRITVKERQARYEALLAENMRLDEEARSLGLRPDNA